MNWNFSVAKVSLSESDRIFPLNLCISAGNSEKRRVYQSGSVSDSRHMGSATINNKQEHKSVWHNECKLPPIIGREGTCRGDTLLTISEQIYKVKVNLERWRFEVGSWEFRTDIPFSECPVSIEFTKSHQVLLDELFFLYDSVSIPRRRSSPAHWTLMNREVRRPYKCDPDTKRRYQMFFLYIAAGE